MKSTRDLISSNDTLLREAQSRLADLKSALSLFNEEIAEAREWLERQKSVMEDSGDRLVSAHLSLPLIKEKGCIDMRPVLNPISYEKPLQS